jgi:hypothetical protein
MPGQRGEANNRRGGRGAKNLIAVVERAIANAVYAGAAWADDRQVVDARVRVYRVKAKDERTEVQVRALEEATE